MELIEAFEVRICPEPNTGCLLWTGELDKKGYGRLLIARNPSKHVAAHRLAFYLKHERWPKPCALHRCDTPACVNVDHLFEGTVLDNNQDRAVKGRNARIFGERHPNSKLTDEQCDFVRASTLPGRTLARMLNASPVTICQIRKGNRRAVRQ